MLFYLSEPGHSHDIHENELVKALEKVLSDDSFKIKVPSTIEARRCAEELLRWCVNNENTSQLNKFTETLKELLQRVISQASTKSFRTNNDKIWRGFFLLRSSPQFINQWTTFLRAAGEPVKPVLFQHLTDVIFRKYLSDHTQVMYLEQQSGSKDAELREPEKAFYDMLLVISVDTYGRNLKEKVINSRKR